MPASSVILPQLRYQSRGPGGINWPINNRPDRGKGIIYSIQWGFQVGNTYPVRGEYVGLTSKSAAERFKTHMQAAGKLSFEYAKQNGRNKSIIRGTAKTPPPDENAQNIFYMALRTGMGLGKKQLGSNSGYRFLKVLAHVSAFDLAAAERALIKARGTYGSFDVPSMEQLMRAPKNYAQNKSFIGFNQSAGGENSMVKKLYHKRDKVLAAVHFLDEGRGSLNPPSFLERIPDSQLGITREDLAFDVYQVIRYFAGEKVSGQEQLMLKKNKKTGKPIFGMTVEWIRKELASLGVTFNKVRGGETKKIDLGDKERFINLLINLPGTPEKPIYELERRDLIAQLDGVDPSVFKQAVPSRTRTRLKLEGEKSLVTKGRKIVTAAFAKRQPTNVLTAAFIIQNKLQKINPNFKFSDAQYRALQKYSKKHSVHDFITSLTENPIFANVDKKDLEEAKVGFNRTQRRNN